jgi:hypothetical protein
MSSLRIPPRITAIVGHAREALGKVKLSAPVVEGHLIGGAVGWGVATFTSAQENFSGQGREGLIMITVPILAAGGAMVGAQLRKMFPPRSNEVAPAPPEEKG